MAPQNRTGVRSAPKPASYGRVPPLMPYIQLGAALRSASDLASNPAVQMMAQRRY